MNGVLVDSNVIGAPAKIANLAILTRDPRRYKHYFPHVKVLSPH